MVKRWVLLAAAIAALTIAGVTVRAEADKKAPRLSVAVIDVQTILRDSMAMKGVREQIEKERKEFQVEIAAEEKKLRAASRKLSGQRGVLAPQAFARRRRRLQGQIAEVQRRFQVRRRQIDQAFSITIREFQKSLTQVVAGLAKERGYDLVLDRRQTIFSRSEMHITAETLKRLNKRLPMLQLKLPRGGAAK